MTITINRKQVLALTNIDFSKLGHLQKLNAIANAFGLRNHATMMSRLKAEKQNLKPGADASGMDAIVDEIASTITARRGLLVLAGPTHIPLDDIATGLKRKICTETDAEIILIRDQISAQRAIDLGRDHLVIGHQHGGNIKNGIRRFVSMDLNMQDVSRSLCGVAAMRRLDKPHHAHTLLEVVNVHGAEDVSRILAGETFWACHMAKAVERVRAGELDPDALFTCFGGQELSGYLPLR